MKRFSLDWYDGLVTVRDAMADILISLMFRSFGREAPQELEPSRRAVLVLAALAFVLASVLILAVINLFALVFGVFVNFLGRNGVRFKFLILFGRLPLVAVTVPVLFGFALCYQLREAGAGVLGGPVLTALLALVLLAGAAALNGARRERGVLPPEVGPERR